MFVNSLSRQYLRHLLFCLMLIFLPGCKVFGTSAQTSEAQKVETISSGLFNAGNRLGNEVSDPYFDNIQPIFAKRCTVCHGCENAFCSLKIVSYRGLIRGGSQKSTNPIDSLNGDLASRLKDGPMLASDAEWKKAWQVDRPQNQRFHPVLPGQGVSVDNALLSLFLKQGNENNKVGFDRKAARQAEQERYDGGKTQCVATAAEHAEWKRKHPQGGMPFGAVGLKREAEGGYGAGELDTLEKWLNAGAPGPSQEAMLSRSRSKNEGVIASWENYLNQNTPKQALVSRYLYEHMFRAHIHFDAMPGEFYEIVRSSTPPGQLPIAEMVTEVPNDEPQELRAGKKCIIDCVKSSI